VELHQDPKDVAMIRNYQRWEEHPNLYAVPTGMAKTHELQLILAAPGDGAAQTGAEAFDQQVLVYPDPNWVFKSDIFGPLGAKNPKVYPELETYLDDAWNSAIQARDDWGNYGFFYYGSGPQYGYHVEEGRLVAHMKRYYLSGYKKSNHTRHT
jgi:hypothetical protein